MVIESVSPLLLAFLGFSSRYSDPSKNFPFSGSISIPVICTSDAMSAKIFCLRFPLLLNSIVRFLKSYIDNQDPGRPTRMFTNNRRQEERTGKYGTPRLQHLQELVSQFQNAADEETKEKVAANLGNFAYDPYNYTFLRQLNVLELFLDCITEPNEKLVEFGIGGICNSCADPKNASIVTEAGGIPLIINCLSSPVRNTVNYALGALYYLCDKSNRKEILKAEVVDLIKRYAAAEAISVSFSNLAKAFLDKHVYATS